LFQNLDIKVSSTIFRIIVTPLKPLCFETNVLFWGRKTMWYFSDWI